MISKRSLLPSIIFDEALDAIFDDIQNHYFNNTNWFTVKPAVTLNTSYPKVNINEYNNRWEILASVAGIDPEDINVYYDSDTNCLVMQGKSINKKMKKDEQVKELYKELKCSSFKRSFSIPKNTKIKDITTNLKRGVLTIILPKKDKDEDKKIQFNVSE